MLASKLLGRERKFMGNRKIGLRDVRALNPGQMIWDAAVVGFGARRQRTEAVSYVLIYRTQEGRQRLSITHNFRPDDGAQFDVG